MFQVRIEFDKSGWSFSISTLIFTDFFIHYYLLLLLQWIIGLISCYSAMIVNLSRDYLAFDLPHLNPD